MTTVVGLLMLVFMSFKIGEDLGVVLAKGVAISLVCIFTVLPSLILMFDKGIRLTAKKVPRITMGAVGRFSSHYRWVLTALFAVIFVAAFIMKGNTPISYSTIQPSNKIDKLFPETNDMVMLYKNDKAAAADRFLGKMEDDKAVSSITSYGTTVGKQYTAGRMADKVQEAAAREDSGSTGGFNLNTDTMKMIYYYHFKDAKTPVVEAGSFISFLSHEIVNNKTFSAQMGKTDAGETAMLEKFSSPAQLTAERSPAEMASFFGMSKDQCRRIYMYYYMKNGGGRSGSMTLSSFVDFLLNDVAADPRYSANFDAATLQRMRQLKTFTDEQSINKKRTWREMASLLGTDTESMKLLYADRFAAGKGTRLRKMTLSQLVTFLNDKVLKNKQLAGKIDSSAKKQLQMLAAYTDKDAITKPMDARGLAASFSLDEVAVNQLLAMRGVSTMSQYDFVTYLIADIVPNPAFGGSFDQVQIENLGRLKAIMDMTVSGQQLSWSQAAQFLGMKASQMKVLYAYRDADNNISKWKLSLVDVKDQLGAAARLMTAAQSGKSYTAAQMADLLGMDQSQARMIYLLHKYKSGDDSGWSLSVQSFLHFMTSSVLSDSTISSGISAQQAKQLRSLSRLTDAVVAGEQCSSQRMYGLLSGMTENSGLNKDTMDILYFAYGGMHRSNDAWTMSMVQLADVLANDLVKDQRFSSLIDEKQKDSIAGMKKRLDDGAKQLRGKDYSIAMIKTTLPDEGSETTKFMDRLSSGARASIGSGDYYLMGNTPMAYEMSQTFRGELNKITLLTIIAIFLVVLLTFRSLAVPAILVMIIQGAVFIMMTTMGLQGYTINYLALLIVQSILMGATIDYAILYTTYYREHRLFSGRDESVVAAYNGSIHTIMTSGLIMIVVTLAASFAFSEPMIRQICRTISIGALSAVILILFILPGVLAACDKVVRPRST
jgi:predicted RND superfamily exporter protein